MIGFIGSVFSPWFHWSGRGDPENHCCINVVTSGLNGKFAMTDRGRAALSRSRNSFRVGPSRIDWTGSSLRITVNEWGALPMIGPLRGEIVLTPVALPDAVYDLTPDGAHRWRPIAPMAHVSVDLTQGHKWEGPGYFDSNTGIRPLEQDFKFWTWGRFPQRDRTVCFYDAIRRDGSHLHLGAAFDRQGGAQVIEPPPLTRMARSRWAVRRESRADAGTEPKERLSLLDAPFYSRALVETRIDGETSLGMHEALDLDRFRLPILKPMLAVRVPRRAGWPKGGAV